MAWWMTLTVGMAASAPILWAAWHDLQRWRTTTNDPSAKDAHLTFLQVEIALLLLIAVATTAGLWLFGRRTR
jgi:hypothetical protein